MDWIGLATNAMVSIPYQWLPVHGRAPSRAKREGTPEGFTAIRSTRPINRR